MKRKLIWGLLLLSTLAFAFKAAPAKRHYFTAHLIGSPDETITGYTSEISGNNNVEVIFDRTGPDVGANAVSVDFQVTFDGQATYHTYTLDLSTNTHVEGWIQGPGIVGDAEMKDGSIVPTYY